MAKAYREECLETLGGGLLSTNSLDSRKRKFINKLSEHLDTPAFAFSAGICVF